MCINPTCSAPRLPKVPPSYQISMISKSKRSKALRHIHKITPKSTATFQPHLVNPQFTYLFPGIVGREQQETIEYY